MLDNKQIRAIFLFKLKVCYKAAETIHNISNTFGTANEGVYNAVGFQEGLRRREP